MIRQSASVRLIWSLGPGPATGGAGGLPPGFLPCALALASRAAILVLYSACSRARRSLARRDFGTRLGQLFQSRLPPRGWRVSPSPEGSASRASYTTRSSDR